MVLYASICVYWKWPKVLWKFQLVLVLASCFLIHLALGSLYTSGNLVPYLVSYIRERSHPMDLRYTDGAYLYTCQVIGYGSTVVFGGILEKRFGPRLVTLLAGLFMCVNIALTYIVIQYSYWLLLLTYGLMYGIGSGMGYIGPLACAMRWLPNWKGVASGIVVSGYGLSSFIFNFVQTGYINPHNKSPNDIPYSDNPDETYFSQPEILNAVPNVFLVLSACYATMLVIGSVFLVNPPPQYSMETDGKKKDHKEPMDKKIGKGEVISESTISLEENVETNDVTVVEYDDNKQNHIELVHSTIEHHMHMSDPQLENAGDTTVSDYSDKKQNCFELVDSTIEQYMSDSQTTAKENACDVTVVEYDAINDKKQNHIELVHSTIKQHMHMSDPQLENAGDTTVLDYSDKKQNCFELVDKQNISDSWTTAKENAGNIHVTVVECDGKKHEPIGTFEQDGADSQTTENAESLICSKKIEPEECSIEEDKCDCQPTSGDLENVDSVIGNNKCEPTISIKFGGNTEIKFYYETISPSESKNSTSENGFVTNMKTDVETESKINNENLVSNSAVNSSNSAKSDKKHCKKSIPSSNVVCDVTPKQMLTKFNFYVLWIMFFFAGVISAFILSLYKAYGLEEITKDDFFLTIVGSVGAVASQLGRLGFGILADFTSYNFVLVLQGAVMSSFLLTLYITSVVGRIMFLFWIFVIFFCHGGYQSIFPTATARLFGQKHISVNFGLLTLSQAAGGLVAGFISEYLVTVIDWYGVFFIIGGLSCLEYILALLLRHKRYNEVHKGSLDQSSIRMEAVNPLSTV